MGLLDQILGGLASGQGGNLPGMGRSAGQAGGGGLGDVLGQVLGGGRAQGASAGGGLGDVLGNILGGGQQTQAGGSRAGGLGGGLNPILMAVLGMLASRAIGGMMNRGGDAPAAGGPASGGGGLEGLRDSFQRGGMGSAFDSWVGTGRNEAPDASGLKEMLGKDQIADIARQLGISESEATQQVAEVMPEVVDRLTPEGRLPESGFGDVGSMLEKLLRGGR